MVGVVQRRNPTVCTEVVGSIAVSPSMPGSLQPTVQQQEQKDGLVVICTLDGVCSD